jgi:CelD/BcsL family acetyltransferase involved in cellulose biosynthesis
MYHVREHTVIGDLRPLAAAWDDLSRALPGPAIFRTFEWTDAWWRCIATEGDRLLVLSVWDNATLACVAPLMIRRTWFGPFPVRAIEFISMWKFAGSAASLLGSMDFVAGVDDAEGAVDAVLQYIEKKKWDVLRLHPLREDSVSVPRIQVWGAGKGRTIVQKHLFDNAVLRPGEDEEGFRSHLSPKFKARLRQAGAKLRRRGTVDFVEFTMPGEVPGAFERIIDIERRSWKWEKGIAITSAVYRGFLPEFATAAARKGWLRLGFLRLDGREIAYSFMVLTGETATFLKTGYDDAHDDCSPGSLLMDWTFDRLSHEGARRIDMFSGDWDYKQRWQAIPEPHCEVQVFNTGPYPRVLYLLYWKLRLYGKGRTPVLLFKRVLRKCGIPWRRSELTRSDQL